uniref:Kinesin motor domain-containing protein n=1 Tax=Gongylonema pulchrum TaxID=637853 RepID=A0A183EZ36_9BILA
LISVSAIGLNENSARRSVIAMKPNCSPAVIRSLSILEEREISESNGVNQEVNPLLTQSPLSDECEKDSSLASSRY